MEKIVRGGSTPGVRVGDKVEITIESIAFGGAGVGHMAASGENSSKGMAIFVDGAAPGDHIRVRIGAKKRRYLVGYVEEFLQRSPDRIEPRCAHFGTCGGCSLQFLSYEQQLKLKERNVRDSFERIGGFGKIVSDAPLNASGLSDEVSDSRQVEMQGAAVEIRPILGCEDPWYYRNKMEISFSQTKEGTLHLGLHVKRRHHDVVELTECFLMADYVGDFVTAVRQFFAEQLPAAHAELLPAAPNKAATKADKLATMKPVALVVREGKNTGEILVNLLYENGVPEFLEEFTAMVRQFFEKREKNLCSLYFTNTLNVKGSPKKVEEKLLWGAPVILDEIRVEPICAVAQKNNSTLPGQTFPNDNIPQSTAQSLRFEISPQAFFQPNTRQAGVLYTEVLKAAALTGTETVLDLFCGAGTIGSFCARNARRVVGIELNPSAVENAKKNAELNGLTNIEFYCGDVAKLLEEIFQNQSGLFEPKNDSKSLPGHSKAQYASDNVNPRFAGDITCPPDVVIVDPPRNGLLPQALELTAALQAKRIVYVSCNPVTQARDAALLKKHGYVLQYVQPVDMFPHTWHIEGVALFTRTSDTAASKPLSC